METDHLRRVGAAAGLAITLVTAWNLLGHPVYAWVQMVNATLAAHSQNWIAYQKNWAQEIEARQALRFCEENPDRCESVSD